jgi:hypothetical protein
MPLFLFPLNNIDQTLLTRWILRYTNSNSLLAYLYAV